MTELINSNELDSFLRWRGYWLLSWGQEDFNSKVALKRNFQNKVYGRISNRDDYDVKVEVTIDNDFDLVRVVEVTVINRFENSKSLFVTCNKHTYGYELFFQEYIQGLGKTTMNFSIDEDGNLETYSDWKGNKYERSWDLPFPFTHPQKIFHSYAIDLRATKDEYDE